DAESVAGQADSASTPAGHPSTDGHPQVPARLERAITTQVIASIVGLGLACGALGALLSARLLRPAPQMRIGVISLTRLSRAIASTTADPGTAAGLGPAFDAAVRRLAQAEPGLVLLVKEAVIDTGGIEDYTDAIIPLFKEQGPRPGLTPGGIPSTSQATPKPSGATEPEE
ncbi:MAG: hypothetical protein L0Z62_08755, partial [Gemmataceae bacterium]|nr:hypothetical protein [Gemmataceae bacterium]